jgi:hypothetical protein
MISNEDVGKLENANSNGANTNANLNLFNADSLLGANQSQNSINDAKNLILKQPEQQFKNTSTNFKANFKQPFHKQHFNANQTSSHSNTNKNYASSQFNNRTSFDNAQLQQPNSSFLPFGFTSPSYYMQPQPQTKRLQMTQQMPQVPPPFFYSTNNFSNRKNYLNYKSYLQAKKAEVCILFLHLSYRNTTI